MTYKRICGVMGCAMAAALATLCVWSGNDALAVAWAAAALWSGLYAMEAA